MRKLPPHELEILSQEIDSFMQSRTLDPIPDFEIFGMELSKMYLNSLTETKEERVRFSATATASKKYPRYHVDYDALLCESNEDAEVLPPKTETKLFDPNKMFTKNSVEALISDLQKKYDTAFGEQTNNQLSIFTKLLHLLNKEMFTDVTSYIYLAHLNSTTGKVIQNAQSGNSIAEANLSGWFKGTFLFLHAWFLLNLIIRFNLNLITKDDCPSDAIKTHLHDFLKYELLVTLNAYRSAQYVHKCFDVKIEEVHGVSYRSYEVNPTRLKNIAKETINNIKQLEHKSEHVICSGFKFYIIKEKTKEIKTTGHAVYISFCKLSKLAGYPQDISDQYTKYVIRIDNRGFGASHHNPVQGKIKSKILAVVNERMLNDPKFLKYLETILTKNFLEKNPLIVSGENGEEKSDQKLINSHAAQLIESLYHYDGPQEKFDINKLQNELMSLSIQGRAGNCVVQSWEAGQLYRLNQSLLYEKKLFAWVKRQERIFAALLFKIIPKIDKRGILNMCVDDQDKQTLIEEFSRHFFTKSQPTMVEKKFNISIAGLSFSFFSPGALSQRLRNKTPEAKTDHQSRRDSISDSKPPAKEVGAIQPKRAKDMTKSNLDKTLIIGALLSGCLFGVALCPVGWIAFGVGYIFSMIHSDIRSKGSSYRGTKNINKQRQELSSQDIGVTEKTLRVVSAGSSAISMLSPTNPPVSASTGVVADIQADELAKELVYC